jgi:hypothetical protein
MDRRVKRSGGEVGEGKLIDAGMIDDFQAGKRKPR